MRLFTIALSCILLMGCTRKQPMLAGGKPVTYWVQALRGPDVQLRKKAAAKLGNVGLADAAALPALMDALKDPDAGVRGEAVLALVKFGPEARDALPALSAARQHDRNARVRSYASRAIQKLQMANHP